MKRRVTRMGAGLMIALALAAAKPEPKGDKTRKVDFDDDTVQGDLTRPDGEYVESRRKTQHSNLIQIRESFAEKVLDSVGEL